MSVLELRRVRTGPRGYANPIEPTIFARYGNWPFLVLLALGVVLALLTRTRRPRKV